VIFDVDFDFDFDCVVGVDVDFDFVVDFDFHVFKRPPAAVDKNPTVFLVGFFSADAIMGGQQGGLEYRGVTGRSPVPKKRF
jgi:hypothetical protein